jgi:hypothetical protein
VNGFLEEAVDEAVGLSSKKWAMLLVAFVAGGAVVLWLVRRRGGPGPSDSERSRAPAAEDPGALRTVRRFVRDRVRNR